MGFRAASSGLFSGNDQTVTVPSPGGYRYETEWRMLSGTDCDRLFVWKANEVSGESKTWTVRSVLFLG